VDQKSVEPRRPTELEGPKIREGTCQERRIAGTVGNKKDEINEIRQLYDCNPVLPRAQGGETCANITWAAEEELKMRCVGSYGNFRMD